MTKDFKYPEEIKEEQWAKIVKDLYTEVVKENKGGKKKKNVRWNHTNK